MTDYFSILPHLNATLNASSFVLLSSGYYFIRRKNVPAHRNCQLAALTASVLFLISYIVYHAHHGVTKFAGQGIVRPVYFTILFTHTFLAVVIVPFVIVTVRRAKRKDFLSGGRSEKTFSVTRQSRAGRCPCGYTFPSRA